MHIWNVRQNVNREVSVLEEFTNVYGFLQARTYVNSNIDCNPDSYSMSRLLCTDSIKSISKDKIHKINFYAFA